MRFEQQTQENIEASLPPLTPEQLTYQQELLRRYGEAYGLVFGDQDNPSKDDAEFLELISKHGGTLRTLLQVDMEENPDLKQECDVFLADPNVPVPPILEEKLHLAKQLAAHRKAA